MASCVSAPSYEPPVYVTFLHTIPRFDFHFHLTDDPQFDPESVAYLEGLAGWAIAVAAFCILLLIIACVYLVCKCCCSSGSNRVWLREPKVGGARCCLALFAVLAAIVAAGAIYGGVQALRDANDVIEDAKSINRSLTDVQSELDSIHVAGKDVNGDLAALLGILPSNQTTARRYVEEALKDFSSALTQVGNIQDNVDDVDISVYIDTAQLYFKYWIYAMIPFCFFLALVVTFPCLVLICCRKSTACLKCSACFSVLGLLVCSLSSGIIMGVTLGGSDICVDPENYIVNLTTSSVEKDVVEYYVHCADTCSSPFSDSFGEAFFYLDELLSLIQNVDKISVFDKFKKNLYVQHAEQGVHKTIASLLELNVTVGCDQITPFYTDARTSACEDAIFYFLIFLLAMIALAIPVTILVMCSENTWRKTAEANKYHRHAPEERTPLRQWIDRSAEEEEGERERAQITVVGIVHESLLQNRDNDGEDDNDVNLNDDPDHDRDSVHDDRDHHDRDSVYETTAVESPCVVPTTSAAETLATATGNAFRCALCLDVARPPVKMHSACGRIVGCEACVRKMTTRQCPLCGASLPNSPDPFETFRGLDDVFAAAASYSNST
ncbi:protein tweety homolog 1-like [Oscarella lobularis]|uniref:protein tweety homolog 1-like n=1 Tax=Oscarella lobularis TaxID=121494 RepID=UPI0033132249